MTEKRVAVITFPGSNCDADTEHVFRHFFGATVDMLWHRNSFSERYDLVVLPGGFSYGDYLRSGAIAAMAPALNSLREHIDRGGRALGICNGFQILCEAQLLPGALIRNRDLLHICRSVEILAESGNPFCAALDPARSYSIPVSHSDGNYRIDDDGLKALEDGSQIAFRYSGENPNGSVADIAGISDRSGRVLGMMPHPERATDPVNGRPDGAIILRSILEV